jgi:hypothetical protein
MGCSLLGLRIEDATRRGEVGSDEDSLGFAHGAGSLLWGKRVKGGWVFFPRRGGLDGRGSLRNT